MAVDWALVLELAIGGAIIGHVLWVVLKPRQRASRAARLCALANVLVWLSFLAFSPPVDDAELGRMERARVERDESSGSLELVTDQPIVVAARWHGTYGAMNVADWFLTLVAGPAIGFAELLILPSQYRGIDATKRASYAIGGIGFVLSTAFWVAFGNVASALRRRRSRRV